MPRKKQKNRHVIYTVLILIALTAAIGSIVYKYGTVDNKASDLPDFSDIPVPENVPQRYHAHTDFKVFINGQQVNFARLEYDFVNPDIHLHVRNYEGGSVIHIESPDVDIGDFFESVGMKLNKTCFSIGNMSYCNNATQTLKFIINNVKNDMYDSYRPLDGDKILVSYGNETETEINAQSDSITALACAFSGKCAFPAESEGKIQYS